MRAVWNEAAWLARDWDARLLLIVSATSPRISIAGRERSAGIRLGATLAMDARFDGRVTV